MKHAIVAIEDERFFSHSGVDLRGIGRALFQDVLHRSSVQGGSTIAQQFVKNALAAQNDRTLFVKLKEATLAYQLTRKWSKQRILRNYLNTIYFGDGAYGIESAARTYFGKQHPGCELDRERPCASQLELHEAAMLAAQIASPSAYNPIAHPAEALSRRNLVLKNMLEQNYIASAQYHDALDEPLPASYDLQLPRDETRFPYFTSWVRHQVVDRLGGGQTGARLAFSGGLRVKTSLDVDFQLAAENAVKQWLPNPAGPRASLVAIDNRTAEVLAMVGGDDYNQKPFNLATQGQRQPGSAFKPFVLAEALRQGISPNSMWDSRKITGKVPGSSEEFTVNNYGHFYAGRTSLAQATTASDNAVYAQVGIKAGTRKIARLAQRMGIRTPVSRNYAITLGALRQGVTPLDLAHAYQTFARGGKLVYGSLSAGETTVQRNRPMPGPVGIREIAQREGKGYKTLVKNETKTERVLDERVAKTVTSMLANVVKFGTAKQAQLATGEFAAGKTGTTENYGDAWFVGWTQRYTVAVWVGHPDKLRPMETEFHGGPVAGGTFPAVIWKTFLDTVHGITEAREKPETTDMEGQGGAIPGAEVTPTATPNAAQESGEPAKDGTETGPSDPPPTNKTPPAAPVKPRKPQRPPNPAPPPPPGGGGGGGGGGTPAPGAAPPPPRPSE